MDDEKFWRQETNKGEIVGLVATLIIVVLALLVLVLFKTVIMPIFALVLLPLLSVWLISLLITHRRDVRLLGLILLDLVLVCVLGAIWIYYGFIYVPSDIAVAIDAEPISTSTPFSYASGAYATATTGSQRNATTRPAQNTVPTSRPKPTSTPRPRYTPTPDFRDYGRSRSQPMPKGKPIEFDDGTTIIVESVIHDADQTIRRHDAWTNPPPSGYQFLLVNIKVSNQGNEPIDLYMVNELSLVGKSNVSYNQGIECWTFPNEIDTSKTIFPSGSLSGNICFTVKSSDVDSLVMYYETYNLFGDDEYIYWALE